MAHAHNQRILGQAGISLADSYDIEGSIVELGDLQTNEVPVVHEMGATMFSERLSGELRRETTGAIAQSITWENLITDLPAVPGRILSIAVFSNASTRISRATVSLRGLNQAGLQQEMPIWGWDTTGGAVVNAILMDNGAAAGNLTMLTPQGGIHTPTMILGTTGPQSTIPDIAFRGITTAFGAGTVIVTLVIGLAFANVGGVSSYGLPIPGW